MSVKDETTTVPPAAFAVVAREDDRSRRKQQQQGSPTISSVAGGPRPFDDAASASWSTDTTAASVTDRTPLLNQHDNQVEFSYLDRDANRNVCIVDG